MGGHEPPESLTRVPEARRTLAPLDDSGRPDLRRNRGSTPGALSSLGNAAILDSSGSSTSRRGIDL
ncbi:hypothetical protein [Halorussus ruber]|uniref:hypothetical protein n=1 Tax=Halorussus ruber TaxID=1126238 RepID=UPI001092DA56|nr:hypothetical protein [Halorussus ruber]